MYENAVIATQGTKLRARSSTDTGIAGAAIAAKSHLGTKKNAMATILMAVRAFTSNNKKFFKIPSNIVLVIKIVAEWFNSHNLQ